MTNCECEAKETKYQFHYLGKSEDKGHTGKNEKIQAKHKHSLIPTHTTQCLVNPDNMEWMYLNMHRK